jgi:DNA polymerase
MSDTPSTAEITQGQNNAVVMRQLVKYLESEKEKGRSHVLLDADARQVLRHLANRPSAKQLDNSTAPIATPAPSIKKIMIVPNMADTIDLPGLDPISPSLPKTEQLAQLEQQLRGWLTGNFPQALRQTLVFSSGSSDGRVMLIGEAPGHEEEKALRPFEGPAGKKLDKILEAMGLNRDEVYVTNLVKFRPATPRQTTNNRKPTPAEVAAFMPVIREEIRIVQPQCIVALGATPLEALLQTDSTVSTMRGSWHAFDGIPLRVTYHPSYLLQSGESPAVKRMIWEDMLAVMEKLGMEISSKQRGYFLPNS